jgi:hypothetical protein
VQNKAFRFGPVAISNVAGNLLNPPTAAGGVGAGASSQYILLRHIRVVNKGAATATFSFFLGATGATAAGTEVIGSGVSVAVGGFSDWNAGGPGMRIDAADFLVGVASIVTTLVVQGEGEIGVSG